MFFFFSERVIYLTALLLLVLWHSTIQIQTNFFWLLLEWWHHVLKWWHHVIGMMTSWHHLSVDAYKYILPPSMSFPAECPQVSIGCSPAKMCTPLTDDGSHLYALTPYKHGRFHLVCRVSGQPRPAISWKSTAASKLSVRTISIVSILALRDLSNRRHAGVYMCESSNSCGKRSATVTVRVAGKLLISGYSQSGYSFQPRLTCVCEWM